MPTRRLLKWSQRNACTPYRWEYDQQKCAVEPSSPLAQEQPFRFALWQTKPSQKTSVQYVLSQLADQLLHIPGRRPEGWRFCVRRAWCYKFTFR